MIFEKQAVLGYIFIKPGSTPLYTLISLCTDEGDMHRKMAFPDVLAKNVTSKGALKIENCT